jgi:hypothetical protein
MEKPPEEKASPNGVATGVGDVSTPCALSNARKCFQSAVA